MSVHCLVRNNHILYSLQCTRQNYAYFPYRRPTHASRQPVSIIYRNPLLILGCLPILLFLFGISIPFSSDPHSLPFAIGVPFLHCPLRLTLFPPFSTLSAFQPSNSLSSLNAFSLSSRSSRSARRADSWLVESLDCSSSIVLRSFSILSRDRVMSSWS
jgi:hypothetical protein